MITAERVARALKKPKKQPDGSWMACCPAHNDKNPSLSIKDGDNVAVVLNCYAGCNFNEISAALEFKHGIKLGYAGEANSETPRIKMLSNWPSTYRYCDENGEERYLVCRQYSEKGKKTFLQMRPDGRGGYIYNMDGIERLPYRLPYWKELDSVVVVEGEKDVDALTKYGIAATCNPGGAGNWKPELNRWFAGKTVYIIPDNDEPGQRHAQQVTEQLEGIAAAVYTSDICAGMKQKADVCDFIVDHKGPSREELYAVITDVMKTPEDLCLSIEDWLNRKIPPMDFLLGELFSTTTRVFLVGPTGLGKTNFMLALTGAMSAGKDFLHWQSKRAARVLYLDGELSRGWAKQLIKDMTDRLGERPSFFYLNTEDAPEMGALNTHEGQIYVDSLIERIGAIDFLVLDNLMSLISGSMKEEEPWAETLPWIKSLTSRKIGVCIVDHMGNDATRTYGTSTKKWQFDTVMLMKREAGSLADIAFTLSFDKARMRTPLNRADYEKVTIELSENEWSGSEAIGGSKKLPPRETTALRILQNLLAEVGEKRITMRDGPNVTACKWEFWREELKRRGVTNEDKPSSERSQWRQIKNKLLSQQVIGIYNDLVWLA